MRPGARTPEELETLFEDAFVTRDREALAELFDVDAVLVDGSREARGAQIALLAGDMWEGDRTYVAEPGRVLQARDTGLIVAERGINVVRRSADMSATIGSIGKSACLRRRATTPLPTADTQAAPPAAAATAATTCCHERSDFSVAPDSVGCPWGAVTLESGASGCGRS
jgi:hypothetical protein